MSCYRDPMLVNATCPSYAKINLHLQVGKKKPDGYHELSTVFHLIDLHDDVTVRLEASDVFACSVTGLENLCRPGTDSLYRAAEAWCRETGIPLSIHMDVVKRIPSGAGMGGGSSNAATVLRVLDAHAPVGSGLGAGRLLELGASLGSDVPFFLCGHAAALGEGRGERLTPVEPAGKVHALVVMPPFAIPTPRAYARLDELRGRGDSRVQEFLFSGRQASDVSSFLAGDISEWPFYNDFQLVCGHDEVYGQLAMLGRNRPGVFSSLTGSGAAWIFLSREEVSLTDISSQISATFGGRFVMSSAILLFD